MKDDMISKVIMDILLVLVSCNCVEACLIEHAELEKVYGCYSSLLSFKGVMWMC